MQQESSWHALKSCHQLQVPEFKKFHEFIHIMLLAAWILPNATTYKVMELSLCYSPSLRGNCQNKHSGPSVTYLINTGPVSITRFPRLLLLLMHQNCRSKGICSFTYSIQAIPVAGKPATMTEGQQYLYNHTVNQPREPNGVRHKWRKKKIWAHTVVFMLTV